MTAKKNLSAPLFDAVSSAIEKLGDPALLADFRAFAGLFPQLPEDSQASADATATLLDLASSLASKSSANSIHKLLKERELYCKRRGSHSVFCTVFSGAPQPHLPSPNNKKIPFFCSGALPHAQAKQDSPHAFSEIKKAVRAGFWEPGGGVWCQPLTALASGESFARQFLLGQKFFRSEFGRKPEIACMDAPQILPSSFPKICRLSGVSFLLLPSPSNEIFPSDTPSIFVWRGDDGSELLVCHPLRASAETFLATLSAAEQSNQQKSATGASLLLLDESAGDLPAFLERVAALPNIQKFKLDSCKNFFRICETNREKPPVWSGDFPSSQPSLPTPSAELRRSSQKSENLLREAECYEAVCRALSPDHKQHALHPTAAPWEISGNEEPPASHPCALRRAWRLLLPHQSTACFSAGKKERNHDMATIAELGSSVLQHTLSCLETLVDTTGFKNPFLLVNPLGFRRLEVIDLPGNRPCLADVPPCGLSVIEADSTLHPSPPQTVSTRTSIAGQITVENGFLRLRFNRKGDLVSLWDMEEKREMIPQGTTANHLVFENPAFPDFSAEEPLSHSSVSLAENHPLRATVKIEKKFGASRWTQEAVVRAGCRRVDFITELDWAEQDKRIAAEFPLSFSPKHTAFDAPFGTGVKHLENGVSHPSHREIFHGCRWADFSETDYGFALLTDCLNPFSANRQNLRIHLLDSSVDAPGHYTFTYSVFPHAGPWHKAGVSREAESLALPLRPRKTGTAPGQIPPSACFFQTSDPAVVISSIKPDSKSTTSVIVRLYESNGKHCRSSLKLGIHFASAFKTTLEESEVTEKLSISNGSITLDFRPFEVVTIRLNPA